MSPLLIKARCQIIRANWHTMQYMFGDLEHDHQQFGEYVMLNLLRNRGTLQHDKPYLITVDPLFRY